MERCGIYCTSSDGSASLLLPPTMRTMTECTDIYSPLADLLFSFQELELENLYLPSRTFFPNKKHVILKVLIPQILHSSRFFSASCIKCSSTLYTNVCVFPAEKSHNFQFYEICEMSERISTCTCNIIPLPVCCSAGLGNGMCLAQWGKKIQ